MYNRRPKINSKIIFNDILPNTKSALIIGENNSDIIEILKTKKIKFTELQESRETKILEFLEKQDNKKYDVIIFNLEFCNYHRLKLLICTMLDKSHYSIIRFRNHSKNKTRITKKKRINKIIRFLNIIVFKKFYSRKNFICKNIIFKPFSYYTVYFITKYNLSLNLEPSFVDKIKNFFTHKVEVSAKLLINKK